MLPPSILLTEAAVFGLVIGSFLNVCIYRLPLGKSLGGRSFCPSCQNKIPWHDNIPLVGFILLRGRCRKCRKPIGLQYPLVEILTAAFSVLTLWHHSFSIIPYFVWFLLFVSPLIVVSFIDIKHQIIPDVISLPGIPAGILALLFLNWPAWGYSLKFSGFGALAGGASLFILGQLYLWIRKKEGMGGGDVKLAAMLGTFLGWKAIIFVFLLSSLLALLYAIVSLIVSRSEKGPFIIPYGPFLATAAVIFHLFGQEIANLYFELLGLPVRPVLEF